MYPHSYSYPIITSRFKRRTSPKIRRKRKRYLPSYNDKNKNVDPPCYNNRTNQIHDYRTQTIKDVPYNHQIVFLLLKKRRYVCTHCDKHFHESYNFLQDICEEPHVQPKKFCINYLIFA